MPQAYLCMLYTQPQTCLCILICIDSHTHTYRVCIFHIYSLIHMHSHKSYYLFHSPSTDMFLRGASHAGVNFSMGHLFLCIPLSDSPQKQHWCSWASFQRDFLSIGPGVGNEIQGLTLAFTESPWQLTMFLCQYPVCPVGILKGEKNNIH